MTVAWVAVALSLVLGLNVVTAAAYAVDKRAARRGRRRVRERTLLALGLAGGWPGALVAQRTLRHKTAKRSFRRAFAGTVVANLAIVALVAVAVTAAGTGLVP